MSLIYNMRSQRLKVLTYAQKKTLLRNTFTEVEGTHLCSKKDFIEKWENRRVKKQEKDEVKVAGKSITK
jgi:hypothetical protein